jgi:O-antigen/teichoic acid export membrane protein
MAVRVTAIAVGSRFGIWETVLAIVIAQVVATAAVGSAGLAAFARYPRVPAVPLGPDRRGILRFALQSSAATGILSLRQTLPTLLVGAVASPLQAGWFRAAQSPQQGFAALSAPARLVLLTEQTRDWERGSPHVVFRGIRRYTIGAALLMAVLVPPLVWFMPAIVKLLFSSANAGATDAARLIVVAGALQLIVGWSKTLPVSIGRPKLRIWTHGLETLILLPLVIALAAEWGATGAGAAVLVATAVFVAAWALLFPRIRTEPVVPAPVVDPVADVAEVLVP